MLKSQDLLPLLLPLIFFFFGGAEAIRALEGKPMIDAEGREYKVAKVDEGEWRDRSPVTLTCSSSAMILLVDSDLYKNGRLVQEGELFLGEDEESAESSCRAVPAGDSAWIVRARLQDCGSTLTISDDAVIYGNKLTFSPAPARHGITRNFGFTLPVSCFYKRTQVVSSNSMTDQILRSFSTKSLHREVFSLRLMNDNWSAETSSRVFHLGDLLHLQASYSGPGPKKVFMDSCVATLTPDPSSEPKYYFVENHGCLKDAKLPGSEARFWSREGVESLRLQLDVVLFHEDPRNQIFITCKLTATDPWRSSRVNKACNFLFSRWTNVDRNDNVCRCCDSRCDSSWKTDDDDQTLGDTVTVGPVTILPASQ